MYNIQEYKDLEKRLRKRKIPIEVVGLYEAWKRIVLFHGPQHLRNIRGLHDEALSGKWEGSRSSRLGRKWRVIYQTDNEKSIVLIHDINAHKY